MSFRLLTLAFCAVLITGAAKRVGAACARMLHDQGCSIFIHYKSSSEAAVSLYNELKSVNAKDLKIGDMLIKGGSPGHIVMICDEVINEKGEKLFLLFQGNTPAQSVHLVKNLEDGNNSPWYQLENDIAISVSNYTFSSAKFVRFK